jgi:molybdenum cofactor cytidylyltransferase/nicotine blue oxidoreductase
MPRVAAAVLAAGAGTRLGGPKAEVVIAGERLVDRAVRVARSAGCEPVFAVVRAATTVPDAVTLVNPEPERGQRGSLTLAVEAASDWVAGVEALAVLLVDTPGVGVDAVRAVIRGWHPGRIAVGRYGGQRGHPIVMAPPLWAQALRLAGVDEGARALLRARPELVDEVPVPGDPTDLDTPADLERWR